MTGQPIIPRSRSAALLQLRRSDWSSPKRRVGLATPATAPATAGAEMTPRTSTTSPRSQVEGQGTLPGEILQPATARGGGTHRCVERLIRRGAGSSSPRRGGGLRHAATCHLRRPRSAVDSEQADLGEPYRLQDEGVTDLRDLAVGESHMGPFWIDAIVMMPLKLSMGSNRGMGSDTVRIAAEGRAWDVMK